MADLVQFAVADHVATITLDSPGNRNALSRQLVAELTAHLDEAEASADVRIVVLTHTGTTFCAGADIKEAVEVGMEETTRAMLALLRQLAALPKPVIGLVRGHVRAGGLGLVGACDIALVSDDCTFAFTEALLGLTPAIISLTTQTRLTERDAARKFLSGATFGGVEAERSGLVTQSVSAEALDAALAATLAGLRKASPQGLRATKQLLNRQLVRRIDSEGPELVALSASLFASAEAREGMLAFRERRLPSWAQKS